MIKVTIDLCPHGDESRTRPLGVILISNDGTGDVQHGNYDVALSHAGIYFGKRQEPWKTGKVMHHNRKLSPYHLVFKAIKSALGYVRG